MRGPAQSEAGTEQVLNLALSANHLPLIAILAVNHSAETPISTPTGHPSMAGALVGFLVFLSAIAISLIPGASEALQWTRATEGIPGILAGFTGHLTHWSRDHLTWDLLAFVALSLLTLRLAPRRYLPCLLVAALLIPLEIRWFQPQFDTYRGLSGIDSALFGLAVAALWRLKRPWPRLLAFGAALSFGSKTAFELVGGTALFVSTTEGAFIPAVSAHLVGALCGITVGMLPPRWLNPGKVRRPDPNPVPAPGSSRRAAADLPAPPRGTIRN